MENSQYEELFSNRLCVQWTNIEAWKTHIMNSIMWVYIKPTSFCLFLIISN